MVVVLIILALAILIPRYVKDYYEENSRLKGELDQSSVASDDWDCDSILCGRDLPSDYAPCTDSDGINIYVKGTTYGLTASLDMVENTDKCVTEDQGYDWCDNEFGALPVNSTANPPSPPACGTP